MALLFESMFVSQPEVLVIGWTNNDSMDQCMKLYIIGSGVSVVKLEKRKWDGTRSTISEK